MRIPILASLFESNKPCSCVYSTDVIWCEHKLCWLFLYSELILSLVAIIDKMDGRISSYFSQNQKKQKTANDGKKKQLFDADGWQRPVGLIKSEAIEIGDSDGEDIILVRNQPISQSNALKRTNNDSDSSSRSIEDAMICPNKDAVKKDKEEEKIKNRKIYQMKKGAIVDLCSPVVKSQSQEDNIPAQDRVKETQTKDTSNDETQSAPVSANPFMQFAHGLGDLESSYFSTLFHERKEEEKTITSKKSVQEKATKSKSSCKPKEKRKRKKTMEKVNNDDCEFAEMTNEQLAKCRRKWQSFADDDAPIEVRRFQVLVAARIHAQSHDNQVRKCMNNLRTHFRKSKGDEERFLSHETLSQADPEEVAKMIGSVLFANVKSKQIIQAANDVRRQFHGKVPESVASLKCITGIGPKLGELLFYVNSNKAHVDELELLASEKTAGIESPVKE